MSWHLPTSQTSWPPSLLSSFWPYWLSSLDHIRLILAPVLLTHYSLHPKNSTSRSLESWSFLRWNLPAAPNLSHQSHSIPLPHFIAFVALAMVCKYCVCVCLTSVYPTRMGRPLYILFPTVPLQQCLAHSRHSVNKCWTKDKVKEREKERKQSRQTVSLSIIQYGILRVTPVLFDTEFLERSSQTNCAFIALYRVCSI